MEPAGVNLEQLASTVEPYSNELAEALRRFEQEPAAASVEDMFEMQMLMNHFSQLCEDSDVVSAVNAALSMIRNIKG